MIGIIAVKIEDMTVGQNQNEYSASFGMIEICSYACTQMVMVFVNSSPVIMNRIVEGYMSSSLCSREHSHISQRHQSGDYDGLPGRVHGREPRRRRELVVRQEFRHGDGHKDPAPGHQRGNGDQLDDWRRPEHRSNDLYAIP